MKKDIFEYIYNKISPLIIIIGLLGSLVSLLMRKNSQNMKIFLIVTLVCVIIQILIIATQGIRKDKTVALLEQWIRYNKKRAEIEQQIEWLSNQLLQSNMSNYLDLHGLIFAGQSNSYRNKLTNYSAFLQQFGLNQSKLEIRKNSAVFLTPFNDKGEILFKECREVLYDMDIYLQKTDNYMEKSDILMNIISLIIQSEIVIVNINGRNPNVYYELGIAHTLGKPTILLSEMNNPIEDIGFDIRQKKIIMYKSHKQLKEQLIYQISNIKRNNM